MIMNKKALVIGNWKYNDKLIKNLKSPQTDIHILSRYLEDYKSGVFDVQTLHNPTYEEAVKETKTFFVKNSGPENLLFYYFSGHGEKDKETDTVYFYNKNTKLNNRETSSLTSYIISQMINGSNGAKIIIVIDSCSGNFYSGNPDVTNSDFSINSHNFALITRTRSYDSTYEKNRKSNSLFTEHLIKALEDSGSSDINDIYRIIFNAMNEGSNEQLPLRRITSRGLISFGENKYTPAQEYKPAPIVREAQPSPTFSEVPLGWQEINDADTYPFFVLYTELDFTSDKYKVEHLWEDYIEKYICSSELDTDSIWKKYCGNDVAKKRIYVSPVRKDNLPVILSIFKTFLNKQVDDIRLNSIDIRNKYYLTAANLQYKDLDSSAMLDPSCSLVYKLAGNLETDKLYLSKDVINLMPLNIKKNLKPISHKSDIFTYTFNLLT
jgi:hypothetical protein